MHKKTGKILIVIGLLFFINAIFGRYLVLPGYLLVLEKGKDIITPSVWGIVRFVLWGYSFKLGAFLILCGAFLHSSMSMRRFGLLAAVGFVYLLTAFAPIPGPYSLFFGIGGGIITALFVMIIYWWIAGRRKEDGVIFKIEDYRIIGYFFFAMATYNLCALTGVSAFALYPEKMIRYSLQTRAASYAGHVMIELVLGWFFTFVSYYKAGKNSR